MIGVPRVARRRPRQVERGTAKGELVRRQLAQHDCSGIGPLLDGMGVAHRDVVLQQLRMGRRPDAGGIVDVLVCDWDAVEGATPLPGHLPCFCRTGIGQRALLAHEQERMELRIEAADALEMHLRKLNRGKLPCRDAPPGFGDSQDRRHYFCSTSKVSAGSASRGRGALMRAIISRTISAPGRMARTWSGVSFRPPRASSTVSSASSIFVLTTRSILFRTMAGTIAAANAARISWPRSTWCA